MQGSVTSKQRADLISRPRLSDRLAAAMRDGHVVLEAPAGYGKTTAVLQAAAVEGAPLALVRVVEFDRDPGRLLLSVVAALRDAEPGLVDVLSESIGRSGELVELGHAERLVADELRRLLSRRLVLFIDNAERIAPAAEALALLGRLIRSGPDALTVAVATRRPLGEEAASLRAEGLITVLGAADLTFTPEECAELLAHQGSPPEDADLDALVAETAGWPLGVAVRARGVDRGDGDAALRHSVVATLDQLDPELRAAVLDSALPEEITPEAAAAIGLPGDFLERVVEIGPFVRPIAPDREGVVYHPMLRELLLDRLADERDRGELRALQATVAETLQAGGRPAAAVEHWLAAERYPAAIAAAEAAAPEVLRTAPATVERWLEAVPTAERSAPGWQLLSGQLVWAAGRHEGAVGPLEAAIAGYEEAGDELGAWRARLALADALTSLGHLDQVVALASGYDSPDSSAPPILTSAVAMYAAMAEAMRGEVRAATELRNAALARDGGEMLASIAILATAYAESPSGHIERLLERTRATVAELERADPLGRITYSLALVGMELDELGRPDEALDAWTATATRAEETGVGYVARLAHAYIAYIHARAGRLAEAEAAMARAGEPVGTGWREWKQDVAEAAIAALHGDWRTVRERAERAVRRTEQAPLVARFWVACELAPLLVDAGAAERADELLAQALERFEALMPGEESAYARGRLQALRAWIATNVETAAIPAEAAVEAWSLCAANRAGLLRLEWPRLQPLLVAALERGAVDPRELCVGLLEAWPDGRRVVELCGHPLPALREAAAAAALESGSPDAAGAVAAMAEDPSPTVARTAQAALARLAEAPAPLHVSLLGGFAVRRGGWIARESDWQRPGASRLVRYLLVAGDRVVPEDTVFEALWPGRSPDSARRALQVSVSRARRVLDQPGADSALEVSAGTIRLDLPTGSVVDSERFAALAEQALAEDPPEPSLLEAAARAWAGTPAPEDVYEDWSTSWREGLLDLYRRLLGTLTGVHESQGDGAATLLAAQELVALDPLDESAQRSLIAAYARLGRRSQALRQYLECRRLLIDAVAVEPAAATTELYERIVSGDRV